MQKPVRIFEPSESIPETTSVRVSIVVVTRNRCYDLARCLSSLEEQTYSWSEILVVDNDSSDDTQSILNKFPVRILRSPIRNLAYLFNLGYQSAAGDVVAYIADDAEAEPTWLGNLVEILNKSPAVAGVGGPTITTTTQEMHDLYNVAIDSLLLRGVVRIYAVVVMQNKLFWPGFLSDSGAYSMGSSLRDSLKLPQPIEVDLLTTTAMAVRKKSIEKIGGFDENFRFNHADGDLFVRLKASGQSLVFNPRAVVWHHVRMGSSREIYNIARDTAYFIMKDIRPHSMGAIVRLGLNVIYLNGYWLYKFRVTKDSRYLKGITAFVGGIRDYLTRPRNR
jgi:GT2 family glycosyltransferase